VTVAALVVAGAALAGPAAAAVPTTAVPAAGTPGGPVVLLGTGGLRWEDVGSTTPALYAALGQDAAGSLAVRSVQDTTCPVDGWLAVAAGRRAADVADPPPAERDVVGCRIPAGQVPAPGGPGTATAWDIYRTEAAGGRFDADPGLLGSTLEAAGVRRAAVGAGALLATADRLGRTPAAWPGVPAGPGGTIDPGSDTVGLADQVRAALATGSRFVAVDLGTVRDPGSAAVDDGSGPAPRDEQVAALDTRIGLVAGALPAGSTVIIASLADDAARPRLQLVLAAGPTGSGGTFSPGLLRTSSTRQDGLAQSTDLLPTIVTALGLPVPAGTVGAPLARVDGGDDLDRLRRGLDLDQASLAVDRLVTPFFVAYGVLELLVLAGLGLVAARSRARPIVRRRALIALRLAAVTFALVPVATFAANLWPWWRGPVAGATLTVAVVAATAPLAGLALAGPWRGRLLGPAGAAGLLTAAVLTADLAAGSPLQLAALIGGQPLIAGRFYGLSNPNFALFATGALFAALALAEALLERGRSRRQAGLAVAAALVERGRSRRQAGLAVAAVGVVATVIDAAGPLGSDFGGPPALVPAFGVLALWVAGVRVTWPRLAAIGAATVGVLLAVAVADWLRPADERTHLGRFVQSVLDGEGWLIVARKAEQNVGILVSTPLTMTVPVATAVAVALLWRPARFRFPALQLAYDSTPLLRPGLGALGVLLLLGFLANDSGTSIPPGSLMLLAPLLVAIAARAVELDDAERLAAGIKAARRPAKR
jgi:hypothetical protein